MSVEIEGLDRALATLRAIAGDLPRGLIPVVDRVLAAEAEHLRSVTHRGPERPEGGVHTQDAYAVEERGATGRALVNTAPQFFAQVDVPAQTIRPRTAGALRFFDGGTAVFAGAVRFPGPNERLLDAVETLPPRVGEALRREGVAHLVEIAGRRGP